MSSREDTIGMHLQLCFCSIAISLAESIIICRFRKDRFRVVRQGCVTYLSAVSYFIEESAFVIGRCLLNHWPINSEQEKISFIAKYRFSGPCVPVFNQFNLGYLYYFSTKNDISIVTLCLNSAEVRFTRWYISFKYIFAAKSKRK